MPADGGDERSAASHSPPRAVSAEGRYLDFRSGQPEVPVCVVSDGAAVGEWGER